MSQRTVEPGLTFFSAGDVRVAVMPVGPVPKDVFEAYARALHERRHVSLDSVVVTASRDPLPPMGSRRRRADAGWRRRKTPSAASDERSTRCRKDDDDDDRG